jgi:hypothetical protein
MRDREQRCPAPIKTELSGIYSDLLELESTEGPYAGIDYNNEPKTVFAE